MCWKLCQYRLFTPMSVMKRSLGRHVRVPQSRMARFRMSVAQQRGEPEEQRPAWRSSRGAAKAAVARARMVRYCMLTIDMSKDEED